MSTRSLRRACLYGLSNAPVGVGIGLHVRFIAIGDYREFPYYAGVAAFVMPALLWFFLIERKRKITALRAATIGVAGAILAHGFTWYLVFIVANFDYWILGHQVGSLPLPPADPIVGSLLGAALYGAISLVAYGWLTLPLGALIGLAWCKFMRGFPDDSAPVVTTGIRR